MPATTANGAAPWLTRHTPVEQPELALVNNLRRRYGRATCTGSNRSHAPNGSVQASRGVPPHRSPGDEQPIGGRAQSEIPGGTVSVAALVREAWQQRAACRGPDTWLFFPPNHFERKDEKEAREARAKAVCRTCPVRIECLDYALRIREPYGIWGGLTELERREVLLRRS